MSQSLEALTNITLLYFTSLLQQVSLFFNLNAQVIILLPPYQYIVSYYML